MNDISNSPINDKNWLKLKLVYILILAYLKKNILFCGNSNKIKNIEKQVKMAKISNSKKEEIK